MTHVILKVIMTYKYRKNLDQLKAYVPGQSLEEAATKSSAKKIFKMASNENPYGCGVKDEDLSKILTHTQRYPDINHHPVLNTLSQRLNISEDQIVLGNGSDDVIQMLGLSFLNPDDHVVFSAQTFSEYSFISKVMNASYAEVECVDKHTHLEGVLDAVTDNTKLIFIANPNNPTGLLLTHSEIEGFLNKLSKDIILVLDEAYIDFVTSSEKPNSLELLNNYENLIILRTFSKAYGLAGYRIGYGIAQPKLINILKKVRQPFNVNNVALWAGFYALSNDAFIKKTLANNSEQKQWFYTQLDALNVNYLKTEANFIFCEIGEDVSSLCKKLLDRGFIVRDLTSYGYSQAFRVTIDIPEVNQAFIRALEESLHGR